MIVPLEVNKNHGQMFKKCTGWTYEMLAKKVEVEGRFEHVDDDGDGD